MLLGDARDVRCAGEAHHLDQSIVEGRSLGQPQFTAKAAGPEGSTVAALNPVICGLSASGT